ncbi:MAG TPA: helix-turn-helix transcriptional regulator [Gemmataceae bacterium]|nr:helix-turn-helix transcriptional regulator [Gemmataceae bacterium]
MIDKPARERFACDDTFLDRPGRQAVGLHGCDVEIHAVRGDVVWRLEPRGCEYFSDQANGAQDVLLCRLPFPGAHLRFEGCQVNADRLSGLDRHRLLTGIDNALAAKRRRGELLAEDPLRRPFGETLKRLRKDANLTQTALATKAGMTRSAIAKFELGEREPLLSTAQRLAEALGVDCLAFQDEPTQAETTTKPKRKKGAT